MDLMVVVILQMKIVNPRLSDASEWSCLFSGSCASMAVWLYKPSVSPPGQVSPGWMEAIARSKKPETLNPEPETAKLGLTSRDLPDVLREYPRSIFGALTPNPIILWWTGIGPTVMQVIIVAILTV